jgi:hypothetical protein
MLTNERHVSLGQSRTFTPAVTALAFDPADIPLGEASRLFSGQRRRPDLGHVQEIIANTKGRARRPPRKNHRDISAS